MGPITRIVVGSLLLGTGLLATTQEASAQRVLRLGRAIASPWYDVAPPPGPAGNLPGNRYYTSAPVSVVTPVPPVTPVAVTTTAQPAEVKVMVRPDADVFVNNTPLGQRGQGMRMFRTAPLERGWAYTYRVTARWPEPGGMVTQERNVSLVAGEQQVVDLNRPGEGFEASSKTPINR